MRSSIEIRTPADFAALVARMMQAGFRRPFTLTVEEGERRSVEQNSLLWALLTDISRQVEWHGQRLAPEDWKDIFTAAQRQQRVVPGIDGGLVALGARTSRMTKPQLSELVELIYQFGADRGVTFREEKPE